MSFCPPDCYAGGALRDRLGTKKIASLSLARYNGEDLLAHNKPPLLFYGQTNKIGREIDDRAVTRINELYYDLDAVGYEDDGHADEIFVLEPPRYKKFLTSFSELIFGPGNRTFLDMATGTGFIPTQLQPFLRSDDRLICVDISEKMLDECKKNLAAMTFKCNVQYKKTDGNTIPVPDNSVNVLTLNSALHHMPRMEVFVAEADRVLKLGGVLMISHESNAAFKSNQVLWTLYRVLYFLYHPAALRETCKAKLGMKTNKTHVVTENDIEMTKYLNDTLIKEGLLSEPLSKHQLDLLVEVHSNEGFNIVEITNGLRNFGPLYRDTYNHLWWIYMEHYKNPIIAFLNYMLAFIYPADGKTMILAYKKVK